MYTHGHDASVLANHRWRTATNSAAYLIARLRPGDSILDVGCGPGSITCDLARLVAPGRVIGVDSSAEVVALASRVGEPGDPDTPTVQSANLSFAVGDVYSLDYADGSFDVVHAHQLLQHLSAPVDALRQMRRVCRSGGIVAVRDADYAAMVWFPADDRLDRWLALYRAIAISNGGQPDAGRHLLSWANQVGFAEVTASAGTWCFATPEDRSWWATTWAMRISDSTLSRQLVRAGLATQRDLDDIADGWRAWARCRDGWFSVIHAELICLVG